MSGLRHPGQHDELLNYRLKRLFSIGGSPAVRLCEGRYGIPRHEWRMLAALYEDGPLSPSSLHERVRVDRGRTSRLLSALVEKRLAKRIADAMDGRRASICLTPKGRALYEELFPQLARINERLMSVLDEEEARLLDDFLQRLTAQAQRILDAGGGVEERADRRHGGSRAVWATRGSPSAAPAGAQAAAALPR